jgi:RNA polymerase sigma factor (sigma-70 family)
MSTRPLTHSELGRHVLDLPRDGAGARPAENDGGSSPELVPLVHGAKAADARAWEALVTRFSPVLRATARSYRLCPADVDDVVQSAWTSALTHIGQLRKPEAIAGWMMMITRREALRTIERRRREIPVEDGCELETADTPMPETTLFADEQGDAVHAAVERLPIRQRLLIQALYDQTETTYDEIAARLGVPVGSIGPTRQRALAKLRRDRNLATLAA